MKNIWITRHGETDFNVQHVIQGYSNSELTLLGLEQIASLGRYFRDIPLDAIYSSDLKRALITAEGIATIQDKVIKTDLLLRERSFGIYEGTEFRKYLEIVGDSHLDLDFRPEKAESLMDVCRRAERFIEERIIASEEKNILIVAHGAYNRCFLAAALNMYDSLHQIKQENCCVNKLVYSPEKGFVADIINCTEHLAIQCPEKVTGN